VLGFGPLAQAADGADFSHSGDFRLIYTNDMNADGDDDAGSSSDAAWNQRLRWGTTVRAGEKLTGHFTLVHGAEWGNNWDTAQYPNDNELENLLLVNEAYATWMASDAWMIRFGRGTFTMADGRFVSTNDWEQVQKAFDGGMATYDHEMARMSLFAVQGANFSDDNAQGNFFGFSADFKSLPAFMKSANLHVVQVKQDDTVNTGNAGKIGVLKAGVVVTGDVAGLDWRVNYEMEDGSNDSNDTDISTSMIDAELGFTVAAAMNARFHVGYHTDSGSKACATPPCDRETYDGFHYDTHNNAGLMDVFGWGNLTYMRVGATFAPADDITVAAEYFMFSQTEKDGTVNGGTGLTAITADDEEDDLGTELDLTVTKKYTNNFNISASYRMFSPGKEFSSDDDYNQLYIESKLTF
jgi:hypothetical protein